MAWMLLAGCIFFASSAKAGYLVKVNTSDLPSINPDGSLEVLKKGLQNEINQCAKTTPNKTLTFGAGASARVISKSQWCVETGKQFLDLAMHSTSFSELWTKAKTKFDWYKSTGSDGAGLVKFTGFNSPTLRATRYPTATSNYPMYLTPKDLVCVNTTARAGCSWRQKKADGTFGIYPDRKNIDIDGALKNKNLEIAYVSDPFDAFIFQVQGAGTLVIDEADGSQTTTFLNYAAENGRPYTSIGKFLAAQGVAKEFLTIPGMRKYFAQNTGELWPTMLSNQSYIFFAESKVGPLGATGTVLTAGHAIAVDRSIYPMSAIALVKTERPIVTNGAVTGWENFSRFALSQDVGGAIKGAGHVDFFWGDGDYAEMAAGTMFQPGELYFAVVKSAPKNVKNN